MKKTDEINIHLNMMHKKHFTLLSYQIPDRIIIAVFLKRHCVPRTKKMAKLVTEVKFWKLESSKW